MSKPSLINTIRDNSIKITEHFKKSIENMIASDGSKDQDKWKEYCSQDYMFFDASNAMGIDLFSAGDDDQICVELNNIFDKIATKLNFSTEL